MPLYHVSITGRDRRHLSALGPKLRVVVVGYREDRRGIVVDAYVPAEKIPWSAGKVTPSLVLKRWTATLVSGRRRAAQRSTIV